MTESNNQGNGVAAVMLFLSPVLSCMLGVILYFNGFSIEAVLCASITLLTACWWVFESLPIPVTSLIPLALFPLLGILNKNEIAAAYGHWLIILLLGGFILSTAMEKSGAHRRLALYMLHLFGQKSDRGLIFGFMVASAGLSMWISNTATTLMLLPIAMAIVQQANNKKLSVAVLLGIAYAANIGGVGTPIGTPPNLLFIEVYKQETGVDVDFVQWMIWAVPVVLIFVPVMGWYLSRGLNGKTDVDLPRQSAWTQAEVRVLIVFALTALAWVTRDMGGYGWKHQFELLQGANDASVALIAAIMMFIIPDGKGDRLLNQQFAARVPWGLLLLFAGGLAIGAAFKKTGLSSELGSLLIHLEALPIILIMLSICLFVTFLTEITSNMATTAILMAILGPVATSIAEQNGMEQAHLVFMFPAVISASCAFMLPVATAPNAVTYGSGEVPIKTMIRTGVVINLIGSIIITSVCYFIVR